MNTRRPGSGRKGQEDDETSVPRTEVYRETGTEARKEGDDDEQVKTRLVYYSRKIWLDG
jgi:hypothetical protein